MNKTVIKLDVTQQVAEESAPKPGDDVVQEICGLSWHDLSLDDLIGVAWSYYYFSISSVGDLEIACRLYPNDDQLHELDRGERDTDNLSPYPGVAAAGERVNHDEFMRRTLNLSAIDDNRRRRLEAIGRPILIEFMPPMIGRRRRVSRVTRTAALKGCLGACCRPGIGMIRC